MTRGFVIVAENNATTDYMKCAEVLARSLKKVMPAIRPCIPTGQ